MIIEIPQQLVNILPSIMLLGTSMFLFIFGILIAITREPIAILPIVFGIVLLILGLLMIGAIELRITQ